MAAVSLVSPTSIHPERSAVRGAAISDLDLDAVAQYLRGRGLPVASDTELADSLVRAGLASRSGSTLTPTSAGLLCFGYQPQLLQPHWGVSCVAVDGRTMADPIRHQIMLEGPLPVLLDGALAFVRELGEVAPVSAVREAIVNALVHRELRHTARVAVQAFSDRLQIRSPGGLPQGVPGLDELSLVGGESIPRNPILASTARALGLGEQIGRGLALIRAATLDRPPTRIISTASEVRVVFDVGRAH